MHITSITSCKQLTCLQKNCSDSWQLKGFCGMTHINKRLMCSLKWCDSSKTSQNEKAKDSDTSLPSHFMFWAFEICKTFLKSPGHYSAKARVRNRYLQSQLLYALLCFWHIAWHMQPSCHLNWRPSKFENWYCHTWKENCKQEISVENMVFCKNLEETQKIAEQLA